MTLVRSRRFAWFAFLAMLSLALLPTLGRLGGTTPPHPGMEMATHNSHAMHAHMPGMAMEMAPRGRTHAARAASLPTQPLPLPGEHDGHDGHDCTYCLLLSGLVATTALHWMPPVTFAATHSSMSAVATRRIDAPVPALGAQGPPVFERG